VVVVVTVDELDQSSESVTSLGGLVSLDGHDEVNHLVFNVGKVEVIVVEELLNELQATSSLGQVEVLDVGSQDELDVFTEDSGDLD
jgi:hypothetical protein